MWYLAAPEHRPAWMRVDRLLGEQGIQKDTAAGREQFERRMEQRRLEEPDEREWKALKRGWFLGSEEFRAKLLEQMEGKLGEHHSGRLPHESAQAKGEPRPKPLAHRLLTTMDDIDELEVVIKALEGVTSGTASRFDWEDLLGIQFRNKRAEALRQLCWKVSDAFPGEGRTIFSPEGMEILKAVLGALKSSQQSTGG